MSILEKSMTRKMQKKEIRSFVYKSRREMLEELWRKSTAQIAQRVMESERFQEAGEVYCYVDYNHEAGTRQIIETCWQLKKRVFVPKVLGQDMEFYEIFSFDDLEPGMKGILEPATFSEDRKGNGTSGVIIMPGVAFDRMLHRIGYGGGFYDQYLERHKKLKKIAVAFEYQVFEEIPAESFDICPDQLITEAAVYEKEL